MDTSLFVERHESGLAFYIQGNLQFDTADEALYHEYLAIPALALAVQRFPNQPLRVLICGGGDGLAARDVLRFPQVRDITLVDYDPEVLALARSEFVPYNQGSLLAESGSCLGAERVTVYTQDAYDFVQQLPDDCYHVVIGDFTCPTRPEDLAVFSLEWFQQIQRILASGGLFALNGVSTNQTPTAFWCLYQTLFAAGFAPKPMNLSIPSFQRLHYGDWGFFLSSSIPIQHTALEQIECPEQLRVLTITGLLNAFQFSEAIAIHRHGLSLNTLVHPHLFYYLLNPPDLPPDPRDRTIDFLAVEEAGSGQISAWDELQLEAIAHRWLAQLNQPGSVPPSELIPVQHYHQTPAMTREWIAHAKNLLAEIDPQQIINQLLARSQELPPKIVQELKALLVSLHTGQPFARLSAHTTELMTILTVTLIMASLSAPDAAYAKGYSSGFHSGGSSSDGYSGSGYHSYGSGSGYNAGYSEGGPFGWIGFWMMVVGGIWLWGLDQNKDES